MDDNSAILEAANQGVYIIPMYMDKSDVAPDTVLTSVVMDWSVPIQELVKAISTGTTEEYRKEHYYRSTLVRDGSIYLGKWAPSVPEEVKSKVEQLEKQFKTGALEVQIEDKKIIE
jgi:basic membrane lipoprotein Med (substrate-binding protein (PBP1-ABC) superfamily)